MLLEDTLFFGDARYPARFHKQKLILHRASMKAYAHELSQQGYRVAYKEYDEAQNTQSLLRQLAAEGCRSVRYADPVDDVLERRLRRGSEQFGITPHSVPSPQFLTDLEWGMAATGRKAPFRMSTFYTAQRRRLRILVSVDGKPTGGTWSLDAENRQKWPRNRTPPPQPRADGSAWVDEATRYVEQRFSEHPGLSQGFAYPVTHAQAQEWLQRFVAERLVGFGTYEDAIVADADVLHHSVLTPMLNIGLLTPQEVIDTVLQAAFEHPVPLNDVEGFVRQIIGWREFMMIMYRRIGVEQRNANFWGHDRALPTSFYDGTTGIVPLDTVIRRVLRTGYCHHIERLMILGNFMLLCELDPNAVYRWFMELFIDAYDWVMVPNVYGMSQFADGGALCTKPYISGSNYVKKMSDFKPGPWCAVWDGLFWRFIHVHRKFFSSQPRLSMMARQLDRMAPETVQGHIRHAEQFLQNNCRMQGQA